MRVQRWWKILYHGVYQIQNRQFPLGWSLKTYNKEINEMLAVRLTRPYWHASLPMLWEPATDNRCILDTCKNINSANYFTKKSCLAPGSSQTTLLWESHICCQWMQLGFLVQVLVAMEYSFLWPHISISGDQTFQNHGGNNKCKYNIRVVWCCHVNEWQTYQSVILKLTRLP